MARSSLARLRKVCLALPEAVEVEAWGAPTFRIGKIFAMYAEAGNHHGAGREGVWVKSKHFTQDLLVRGQPARYFVPPYVGPQGWTGVYLDGDTDWDALTELLRDAYRSTAPRRLAALVPDYDVAPVKQTPTVVKAATRSKRGGTASGNARATPRTSPGSTTARAASKKVAAGKKRPATTTSRKRPASKKPTGKLGKRRA